jgi:hypothetical protein
MGRKAKNKQDELSQKMFTATDEQLKRYNDEQVVQRKLLETQKARYRQFEFKNPYAAMENVMEDVTVDMRAADFQAQQGQQQRANILQALRGAAGGSGIAALAQSMANQGALQTQAISATIGQQERQNQIMKAKMAGQIDMTERGGQAMVQSAEMGRQSTLLGIEYGGMAGANAGVQAAYANQMASFGAQAGMANAQLGAATALWGAGLQAAGTAASGIPSDRELKKNINKIGESPSGLNIYSFEFKNSKYGKGLFQGVMSDEIPQEAVGTRDGYDIVDYSMLDVEFKQI